jgi:predicted ribosome quality control (RQC) complex YloA/Tae2 family protein
MSLNASEIAAVAVELAKLAGSRVDAIRVHAERALTLELHGRSGATLVLVSAEPDVTRVHVASERPSQPVSPYAFQQVLRRELASARLAAVEPLAGDRVVSLRFDTPAGPCALVAELTGRHGNLFLVGGDGIIRASAARNLSERRELVPGKPYVAPAPRAGASADPAPRFEPLAGAAFPLSAAIEAQYAGAEAERLAAEGRKRLREPVRAAIARSRRALDKIAEDAARVPAAEADRRLADLLKQNLHQLRRGAGEVTLTEWTEEGPREVAVVLDPALPPRENMERYYRRYRRIAESAARVAARRVEVEQRLADLLRLLDVLDAARLEDLPRLEREARRLGAPPRPPPKPRSKRDEPALPYRAYRSAANVALLAGKSAADNDALTLRVARGNDVWLHARGIPGSHVVVRLDKGKAPDQETLLDAAHLAAWFSDARGEPTCEVVWTRAKYVRKPKGSAPGAVVVSQERTMLLRVEPGRTERILATEESV